MKNNIVIFGPPGAGKGTQCKMLSKKLNMIHISTGDLFRYHIDNNTEIGKEVKKGIANGNLASDELTNKILLNEINKNPNASFLLDGYPRTIEQCVYLDSVLEIKKVINIDISEEEIFKRIAIRKVIQKREDDNIEKLKNRLFEYNIKTKKVLNYYKNQNKVITINGSKSVEEVFEQICQTIQV